VYSASARLVAFAHFVFVALAVFGAFLVRPVPGWIWIQIPIALWSAYVFIGGAGCPLTPLENALRRRSGGMAYEGGFVEHYITRRGLGRRLQVALGVVLLAWNAVILALLR
jgi:hypothetical protein